MAATEIATAVLAWCASSADAPHNTIGKAVAPLVGFESQEEAHA
jgi:hypothetical protein